jgi:hypothetical protein
MLIDMKNSQLLPVKKGIGDFLGAAASWLAPIRRTRARGLPPLFLHVGLPKTATTTLQNTLFARHSGLYYLGKSPKLGHPRGCRSKQIYETLEPILWSRFGITGVGKARRIWRGHLDAVGDKVSLGSWEGLGQNRQWQFERMVRNLEAVFGDLRLVFTLRNPLTQIPSAYLYGLKVCAKAGAHHSMPAGTVFLPFDDWLYDVALDGHDHHFAFGNNLKFAVRHLGVERVGVFLFEDLLEDPEVFFQGMAEFLGIDPDEARKQKRRHLNPALTTGQFAFLQRTDASASERQQWLALPLEERVARFKQLRAEGGGEKYRLQLSAGQAAYIAQRSAELNRWIAATFQLDLGRHGYPL